MLEGEPIIDAELLVHAELITGHSSLTTQLRNVFGVVDGVDGALFGDAVDGA
jgi:hypothetical protein